MTFPSGQNEALSQTEERKALGSDLGLIFKSMGLGGGLTAQLREETQKH